MCVSATNVDINGCRRLKVSCLSVVRLELAGVCSGMAELWLLLKRERLDSTGSRTILLTCNPDAGPIAPSLHVGYEICQGEDETDFEGFRAR
jgi:hypothetical protein